VYIALSLILKELLYENNFSVIFIGGFRDLSKKSACLHLGQKARLFVKSIRPDKSEYSFEYVIEFEK
jgi:hypothetical protein